MVLGGGPKVRLAVMGVLLFGLNFAPSMAGEKKEILVADAWVQATPPTVKKGAAYMVVHNNGKEDDLLLSLKSSVSKNAEFHSAVESGGIVRMLSLESISLPSGGSIIFEAKGYHIMLSGLDAPLKEGDTVELTLIFKNAGEIKVSAPVFRRKSATGHDHTMSH